MGTPTPTGDLDQLLDLTTVRAIARSGQARELRERAGLSLQDVAVCVGTSAATIARWETGLRRPARDLAIKYGHVLAALSRTLGAGPLTQEPRDAAAGAARAALEADVDGEAGQAA